MPPKASQEERPMRYSKPRLILAEAAPAFNPPARRPNPSIGDVLGVAGAASELHRRLTERPTRSTRVLPTKTATSKRHPIANPLILLGAAFGFAWLASANSPAAVAGTIAKHQAADALGVDPSTITVVSTDPVYN